MSTAFKQVKNGSKSTLASAITSTTATSATIQTGDGTKFPIPGNGFWATIWDKTTYPDPRDDPTGEIVFISAASTDTFTIARGQLSTTASTHAAGAAFEMLLLDQHFDDFGTAINNLESAPSGDMLKATYDPANVNAQLAADSAVVHKAGDSMSGALSVAVTSGTTTPITATVDSSAASQPAVLAKNNTNYAHGGNIIKAQMLNATDTGVVVRIENAGTGKNISSANGTTETFSVDKTGIVVGGTYNGNTIGTGSTTGSNTGDQTTITGNAGTATALQTGRTIQTNLASTTAVSFNGSANITPGVTGTLPLTNGGTGSTTKNFVDLTTAQTVAGVKTFSSTIISNIATGTAPLTVTSTTKVTNLNADQVDGFQASGTATANTLFPLNGSAKIPVDVLGTGASTVNTTTTESTASTTFADLATVGPSVTVTIGANGLALVTVTSHSYNNSTNDTFHGFAVSGMTTIAANDLNSKRSSATSGSCFSGTFLVTGLTPGSNTFTSKYRVATGTGSYLNRIISVIPL